MKTKLLLIFITVVSYAHSNISYELDTTYLNGIGKAIQILKSKDIIVGGYKFNDEGESIGILINLDSNGLINWRRELKHGTTNLIADICVDNESNIYVIGTSEAEKIFVAKFDDKGEQVWYKVTDSEKSQYSDLKINIDSKGNLAFINNKNSIIFFNSKGEITKSQKVHYSIIIQSFIFDQNDNIIAVGETNYNISVIKLNNKGELIAKYKSDTPDNSWAVDIDHSSENSFVVLGVSVSDINIKEEKHKKLIMKFDNNLDLIWQEELTDDIFFNGSNRIKCGPNDELVVASYTFISDKRMEAKIFFFDIKGQILDTKIFGGNKDDIPFDIVFFNNDVIFTGEKNIAKPKFWIKRTNNSLTKN